MLLVNRRIARLDLGRDINVAIGTEIARTLTSRGHVDLACHDHDHHDLDHNYHDQHNQDDQDDQDNANNNDNDNGYDIPKWVADRVNEFVLNAGMYPFVKEIPQQGMGCLNEQLVGVAIAGRGAALHSVPKDHKDCHRTRKGRKSMHIVGLLQSGWMSWCRRLWVGCKSFMHWRGR